MVDSLRGVAARARSASLADGSDRALATFDREEDRQPDFQRNDRELLRCSERDSVVDSGKSLSSLETGLREANSKLAVETFFCWTRINLLKKTPRRS